MCTDFFSELLTDAMRVFHLGGGCLQNRRLRKLGSDLLFYAEDYV